MPTPCGQMNFDTMVTKEVHEEELSVNNMYGECIELCKQMMVILQHRLDNSYETDILQEKDILMHDMTNEDPIQDWKEMSTEKYGLINHLKETQGQSFGGLLEFQLKSPETLMQSLTAQTKYERPRKKIQLVTQRSLKNEKLSEKETPPFQHYDIWKRRLAGLIYMRSGLKKWIVGTVT